MKPIGFFLLISLLILSDCTPSEREQAQQDERLRQMQMQFIETTPEFTEELAGILDHYFDLKNALVKSDAGQARTSAGALGSRIREVKTEGLNEETVTLWLSLSETLLNSSGEISSLGDVEDQRFHFETLSGAMINVVETFRPAGYDVYHQSCPMVRDGSADWLSREEQIANPYHGDRMMNCGEVVRKM